MPVTDRIKGCPQANFTTSCQIWKWL